MDLLGDPDVIVIGAGVVGAAAARSLAARGRRVLLVEQHGRGHHRGSSHGGSRIFRMGYTAPDYIALTQRSLDGWRALEAASGRTLIDLTGAVEHGRPAMVDAVARAMSEAGVPHDVLTPEQASERWPGLAFEGTVLTHPTAGRIRADAAIEALLDLAAAEGADLRFDTPVRAVAVTEGGVTVTLADGTAVSAPSAVAAVGSWVPTLVGDVLAGLGVALPTVRVTQEQPAHFATRLPDAAWPSFVHYPIGADGTTDDGDVYGLLTPGEGVKVGFHGTGPVVHPDERDFEPDRAGLEALREYVRRWVPGVDADALDPISCLYDTTPDEDFVVDRVGPLTVTTGFSGHGFKFAPVLGEMVADLVAGGSAHPRFAFRP